MTDIKFRQPSTPFRETTNPGAEALPRRVVEQLRRSPADRVELGEGEITASQAVALHVGLDVELSPQVKRVVESLSPALRAQLAEVTSSMVQVINYAANGGSNVLASAPATTLVKKWSAFITDAVRTGKPVDVNALVQFVLRESYLSTTQDLYFYAEKVKFFNDCKKKIRDELTRARQELAKYAGSPDEALLQPPFVHTPIPTDFVGDTFATPDPAAAAAHKALQEASNTLTAAQSGGGLVKMSDAERAALKPPPNGEVFVTSAGYRVDFEGNDMRVYNPPDSSGTYQLTTHVWGDPHVNETKNSGDDWHFADDSTFILPDGTKISVTTQETSPGVSVAVGIDVLSGGQRGHAGRGPNGNEAAGIYYDRAKYDVQHGDTRGSSGGVFALQANGEWAKRGADGQFRDVAYESWDSYLASKNVDTHGGVVTLTAQQMRAAADDLGPAAAAFDTALANAAKYGVSTTKGELDAYIKGMEEKLSSVGDDAQLANVDLQNVLQKQQQTIQLTSNISKMLHDTAMAIVRKIGG